MGDSKNTTLAVNLWFLLLYKKHLLILSLLEYWRDEHKADGYQETKTPVMLSRTLWEQSGHWGYYRQNMYTSVIDDEEYAIKPMNCPGGMLLYKTKTFLVPYKNKNYRNPLCQPLWIIR